MIKNPRLLSAMPKQGPFFAIVTPFANSGRIDEKALFDYLKFLEKSGSLRLLSAEARAILPR